MSEKNKIGQSRVHLIGVGGIGMSGIAEILTALGAKVSGSDIKASDRTRYLEGLGVQVFIGHDKKNLETADVVVYSSAIQKDNPEMTGAIEKKVPLIPRAEALAELMRSKRGLAVAGTHGKTTTTSMMAQVFESAGRNPTVVSGGIVLHFGTNAKLGKGEWFVVEADESDGSFERLSPEIAVVTNIDNDHIEHYGDFKALEESFVRFADKIPFYGSLIYCGDDEDCNRIFSDFRKKKITYGFGEENDFYLRELPSKNYQVFHKGKILGDFEAPLPGNHNALNALAALVVAVRSGLDFEEAKMGIESFSGVRRRFEVKADFERQDIMVIDDYAHHPTEITAVLTACKNHFLGSRIRCVFQPHRYSRLKGCWDQFKNAFDMADELFLLDVYAAGEKPLKGYESYDLAEAITHKSALHASENFEDLTQTLVETSRPGDLVLTLGAGDVYKVSELFAKKFAEK